LNPQELQDREYGPRTTWLWGLHCADLPPYRGMSILDIIEPPNVAITLRRDEHGLSYAMMTRPHANLEISEMKMPLFGASTESPRQASSMTYCDVTRVYVFRSSDHHRFVRSCRAAAITWDA